MKTLFYPFETDALTPPGKSERVLFLGAEPSSSLPDGFEASIVAVQGFRSSFVKLQQEGKTVLPVVDDSDYDAALVLCGRHRGENELRLAEAIQRVKPNGLVVVAGGKTDGVGALMKRLEKKDDWLAEAIAGRVRGGVVVESQPMEKDRLYRRSTEPVPVGGHLSKNHGIVFWLNRSAKADSFARVIQDWYGNWPLVEKRFRAAPGMFSHDRIDAGSRLLAEHLPKGIKGKVADFCAGWGYLSAEIAARYPGIKGLDLYEADFASLEAAKGNLTSETKIPLRFFWHDLTSEPVTERYDAIIMNPPFHTERRADPGMGQAIIKAAAGALKRGGYLYMVANRQLAYEHAVAENFHRHSEIAGDKMYKVIAALR